jgi:hypothetical protein
MIIAATSSSSPEIDLFAADVLLYPFMNLDSSLEGFLFIAIGL